MDICGDFPCTKILVNTGKGIITQDFFEFKKSPDPDILNCLYGKDLFDILFRDLNVIGFKENEEIILKIVFQENNFNTENALLGKIAEALVVRRCHEDDEINIKYFSLARGKLARRKTAKRFFAIGTGLESTKMKYPQQYNPTDPQWDVQWIDLKEKNRLAIVKNNDSRSTNAAQIAGLQIKTSQNGVRYVLNDILDNRYLAPVIYFGLNNDLDRIKLKLSEKAKEKGISLNINAIVSAVDMDPEGYEIFLYYKELLHYLIEGKLTPKGLLQEAKWENKTFIKSVLLNQSLDMMNDPSLIVTP